MYGFRRNHAKIEAREYVQISLRCVYKEKRKGRLAGARFQRRSGPKNERTTHDGRSFRIRRPPLRFSAGAAGEKNSGKVGKWESGKVAKS